MLSLSDRARIVLRELRRLYPEPTIALHYNSNWELLVAVVLSAQCTDKRVNMVTEKLFKQFPTVHDMAVATQEVMEEAVRSTGYYRAKAKNIIAAANKVVQKYGGLVPHTMEELESLPGVGRKTANVIMAEAFNDPQGIAVDTHVTRLARKFGLTTEQTPKKIEHDLLQSIPKKEWQYFTLRMIQYGRDYSPAHKKADESDPISVALKKVE